MLKRDAEIISSPSTSSLLSKSVTSNSDIFTPGIIPGIKTNLGTNDILTTRKQPKRISTSKRKPREENSDSISVELTSKPASRSLTSRSASKPLDSIFGKSPGKLPGKSPGKPPGKSAGITFSNNISFPKKTGRVLLPVINWNGVKKRERKIKPTDRKVKGFLGNSSDYSLNKLFNRKEVIYDKKQIIKSENIDMDLFFNNKKKSSKKKKKRKSKKGKSKSFMDINLNF